jgi:hypothetical protein
MSSGKEVGEEMVLSIKTVTWQKDSHSLFDYEFNKNVVQGTFEYDLAPKFLYMFRNNASNPPPTQPATSASTPQTNSSIASWQDTNSWAACS